MRPLLLVMGLAGAAHAAIAAQPPATFDECEAMVREDPSDLRCFALIAGRTRQWDEAVRRLEGILQENPTLSRGWWSLAYIEHYRGKERSIDLYRKAADGLEQAGVPMEASLALCDMATALMTRGRLEEVDQALTRAEELARRSGSEQVLTKVRTEQAWRAFNRDEFDAAEAILREVEPVVFSKSPPNLQDRWLSAMGSVCWATGRYPEARTWYRKEAGLLEKMGDLYSAAGVQYNIALVESWMQLPDEQFMAQLRIALKSAIASGNRGVEAQARVGLASYENDVVEARALYQRALEISREIGNQNGMLSAMRLLGESYSKQPPRNPERGRRLLDEALALARQSGDRFNTARSLILDAHLGWRDAHQQNDLELRRRSLATSLEALHAIEEIRGAQEQGVIRARVQGEWFYAYQELAALVLATSPPTEPARADLELATQAMERLRGRTLIEEVESARRSQASPARFESLHEIAVLQRKLLDGALPATQRQKLLTELSQLEAREASLSATGVGAPPANQPPVLLESVEAALAPDVAILSFVTADLRTPVYYWAADLPDSWLLVHTQHATRAYSLPDRAELEAATRLFVGLFETRDGSELRTAVSLYKVLLAQALAALPPGIDKLVIIPDGVLHRLPFAALRETPGSTPLGARFEVTMSPSITAWLRWSSLPPGAEQLPVLALADPAVITEVAVDSGTDQPAAQRAWAIEIGGRLGRLPHARAEAAAIIRYLGGGSRILEGEQASERAVKEVSMNSYSLLHLAAHGLVDEQRPERSGVLLAAGSDEEDGLLQTREIVDLDLSGRVVVLSACRSASGTLLRGEGFMGLARAFFVAGARTVVASLWPLRDDEAAALFSDFYRHIGQGASVASAMSAARRDRILAGAPAAGWAGVVVLGDGSAVPMSGGRRPSIQPWHMAVAALLILAGVALARARRLAPQAA